MNQPAEPIADIEKFEGAGLYVFYYVGDFPVYEALSARNSAGSFHEPIYVGKAIPKGGRKGGSLDLDPGAVLYQRITQHRRSLEEATNLDVADFYCRRLVVDDIWISLGETLLIAKFKPLWNSIIDGFGNHDPGKGRHRGMKSRWDVLHPGRSWAERLKPREETADALIEEVKDFLRQHPPAGKNPFEE
ncbi:MAG: Eco29kI family restriction endonuclease [Ignavibacteriales bacterium]|nr:Eco29kI family restriction endonuclease [Ignavibacteriales bacterium]